ncbi:MAG: YggS family pyridoxal phosphate-dependent enzyme [Firmicutes bacterium]|nr:YggS family pyridoxal phosphate-dependent enzyme [Bacillota bacterium]MCL5040796.1 YggS family pyridoxal phosphate-dependent enzyme [Bacillota bacterium]
MIRENLERVRERVTRAAERVGRDPAEITIVAVTKQMGEAKIKEVILAGAQDLGENRIQEGREKALLINDWWRQRESLPGPDPGAAEQSEVRAEVRSSPESTRALRWHLIGHLQTNKVKYAVGVFDLIHSVDSVRLLEEINRRAGPKGLVVPILIELNISGEESKSGLAPAALFPFLERAAALKNVSVQGLMTMAPLAADPEATRPVFRGLRELAERAREAAFPRVTMGYLSMGMSNDFEVAIEEGANIVRIGTAIFGQRG